MTTVHAAPAEPVPGLEELADYLGERPRRAVSFTKGALESLLPLSLRFWDGERVLPLDDATRDAVEARNRDLAANDAGLAAAPGHARYWRGGASGAAATAAGPRRANCDRGRRPGRQDLVLVGLIGMIDPARAEARDAVLTALAAGIRPAMITGDQPLTAASIAVQVGIVDAEEDGQRGAGLPRSHRRRTRRRSTPEELEMRSTRIAVYARVAPEQKLTIVQALQEQGHIVAMTGDGVNDAPALRKADIGVAMGITGTDVAKEAADMVSMDDNFATIVAAVNEGRAIYDNIRKFIKYLMATNVGELTVMLVAPLPGHAATSAAPADPVDEPGHRRPSRAGTWVRAPRARRHAAPAPPAQGEHLRRGVWEPTSSGPAR